MEIVIDVLNRLDFNFVGTFGIETMLGDEHTIQEDIKILVSNKNSSQVFLLLNCDNNKLKYIVDGEFIKLVAVKFRKTEYHRAEMDKNTTLLIISHYEDGETIDTASKVWIEDDPYYFKKYVFSYNNFGLAAVSEWIKDKGNESDLIDLIQEYITDTKNYTAYKTDCENNHLYSFLIELITKIHGFPMKSVEAKDIQTIDYFLKQEIEKLKDEKKNPVEINAKHIESFMESDIDFSSIEEVCDCWNRLVILESGE